jgi:serine/threonine protein kinase
LQTLHAVLDPALFGITPGSDEEHSVLQEFASEAVMLSKLHHTNVVAFRGVVLDPVRSLPLYIVTELADGNLRNYLKGLGRPFTARELKRCAVQIAHGLHYLHTFTPEPIIHRDLKPENILYVTVDDMLLLKVTDVGLARFSEKLSAVMTRGVGTPFYAAPELFARIPKYSCLVDMWSFGVLLAELVACYVVHQPSSRYTVETTPLMISLAVEHLLGVDAALAAVVEGCCREDPHARLTASAVLARLSTPPDAATGTASSASPHVRTFPLVALEDILAL